MKVKIDTAFHPTNTLLYSELQTLKRELLSLSERPPLYVVKDSNIHESVSRYRCCSVVLNDVISTVMPKYPQSSVNTPVPAPTYQGYPVLNNPPINYPITSTPINYNSLVYHPTGYQIPQYNNYVCPTPINYNQLKPDNYQQPHYNYNQNIYKVHNQIPQNYNCIPSSSNSGNNNVYQEKMCNPKGISKI